MVVTGCAVWGSFPRGHERCGITLEGKERDRTRGSPFQRLLYCSKVADTVPQVLLCSWCHHVQLSDTPPEKTLP